MKLHDTFLYLTDNTEENIKDYKLANKKELKIFLWDTVAVFFLTIFKGTSFSNVRNILFAGGGWEIRWQKSLLVKALDAKVKITIPNHFVGWKLKFKQRNWDQQTNMLSEHLLIFSLFSKFSEEVKTKTRVHISSYLQLFEKDLTGIKCVVKNYSLLEILWE